MVVRNGLKNNAAGLDAMFPETRPGERSPERLSRIYGKRALDRSRQLLRCFLCLLIRSGLCI